MERTDIDISVIVPIYNVEEYLRACLESLLKQGTPRLEVLMVDDGSTDHSGEIAKEYADRYPNFTYYRIENGGLGHARNYGMQYARGKYIAFVDSDDVVVGKTYEKMFILAERDKSELTICNAIRFNSKKYWNSGLHRKIFNHAIKTKTHITRSPELIYDAAAWNKLILREFYLKRGFRFPENILYEDIPVTIPMHFFAKQVSILHCMGYLWRVRDGATASITQTAANMQNVMDRIRILEILDEFFEREVSRTENADLWKAKQKKALDNDLMVFLNKCPSVPHEQAAEMLTRIKEYIDKAIDPALFGELSLINRQKYEYVKRKDVAGLTVLCEHEHAYSEAPVVERDGRLLTELPAALYPVKERDITQEMMSAEVRKYIDSMQIKNTGIITLRGHIYKRRINLCDTSEQEVQAFLFHELSGERIPVEIREDPAKELTENMGSVVNPEDGKVSSYKYDGAGFRVIIDIKRPELSYVPDGCYKLLIRYKNRFSQGEVFLGGCGQTILNDCKNAATVGGNCLATVKFSYLRELEIHLRRQEVFFVGMRAEKKELHCLLDHPVAGLWAAAATTKEEIPFQGSGLDFFIGKDALKPDKEYTIQIEREDGEKTPLCCRGRKMEIYETEEMACIASSVRTCTMRLRVPAHMTRILAFHRKGNRILLRTRAVGRTNAIALEGEESAVLCVEDRIAERDVVLSQGRLCQADGRAEWDFQIDFDDPKLQKDFYQSIREIYIKYRLPGQKPLRERLYSQEFYSERFLFDTLEIRLYRGNAGTARLGLKQLWREQENSASKRKLLILQEYPRYRKAKIHPRRILFESMWGAKYSCNPRALYEYIDKYYPQYECIWSLNDPRMPINGRGKRVRRGSWEYWYYMATAKYFVSNVNFQTEYVKREGQIEIQTMHGTPLKTLGLDVAKDFPTEQSRQRYIEKNRRWNYLIVQGRFMEERAESIFAYTGKILPTGYPRTDGMFKETEAEQKALKAALGLPEDKKIILYAPTWRVKNRFDMRLDLKRMCQELAGEYILLVRIHHLAAAGYKVPADRTFIFDLTSYSSIEGLYQISDILITDYSSVMFDYALLDKPMLFFTYDLEEYRDQLRGMYVDLEREAPGPLVQTTDEVVAEIRKIEKGESVYQERARRFKEKFLGYECADSCRQVTDLVLKPRKCSRFILWLERLLEGFPIGEGR
ncbi:MAG: glycosyltransferase [Lachnospiraceae bacterium]|nr:glycosyltransferase [Lachnospiraceae bacterium]